MISRNPTVMDNHKNRSQAEKSSNGLAHKVRGDAAGSEVCNLGPRASTWCGGVPTGGGSQGFEQSLNRQQTAGRHCILGDGRHANPWALVPWL